MSIGRHPACRQLDDVHRLLVEVETDQIGLGARRCGHGEDGLAFGDSDSVERGHSCDLVGVERGRRHDDVGESAALGGGVQCPPGDGGDREDADRPDRERQREDAGEDAARRPAELVQDSGHLSALPAR